MNIYWNGEKNQSEEASVSLADIVVSVLFFNPTLNSPTAHIQSEVQGNCSVTPG